MAGTGWSAQGWRGVGSLLGWRLSGGSTGYPDTPAVVAVSGVRGNRWLWTGSGLRLAGQHPDPLVSRPARHGCRDGDHGIWWRRNDWDANERIFHSVVLSCTRVSRNNRRYQPGYRGRSTLCPGWWRIARGGRRGRKRDSRHDCAGPGRGLPVEHRRGRCCRDVPGNWLDLPGGHAYRGIFIPFAGARLEAGRLAGTRPVDALGADIQSQCGYRPGSEDAPVLPAVDSTVSQCDCGNRGSWCRSYHDYRDIRLHAPGCR